MPPTNPNKPLCERCKKRNAQPAFDNMCNKCYRETRDIRVPRTAAQLGNINEAVKAATTDDDWKKLAQQLAPTYEGIAEGTIKATAAQASILKTIWDRAYGRVTKAQDEKTGPSGIVVLPTLDNGKHLQICPKCLETHFAHAFAPIET